MTRDEKYMYRCLQLALNGKGFVAPNPMVGAVVVHNNRIIGEGFHRQYGEAHAEVNAIANVKDKSLLKEATIYVSLEPCSHYGKTPPCAQLIIDNKIQRVVIACEDPYPAVSGRGIRMMREAGIDVEVGVLKTEAQQLNKEFITLQTKGRPYIYLKWAQTKDGFIDKKRIETDKPVATPISNSFTKMLVHKKRAETASIMIGTNTAINDNPALTTRLWYGKNPVRIIIDRNARIPKDYNIFDQKVETLIYTQEPAPQLLSENIEYISVNFNDNLLENICSNLKNRKINSVLVEGGQFLLQSFIDKGIWDEAYIEIANIEFGQGIKAPTINGTVIKEHLPGNSKQIHLKPLEL
jgi:diaminohydroxyphosphoribosylaminopyrimidine deaminase/5-amino-6-(5-phosphoribosylamino)uracil reductase